jgi:hypothetical protein
MKVRVPVLVKDPRMTQWKELEPVEQIANSRATRSRVGGLQGLAHKGDLTTWS